MTTATPTFRYEVLDGSGEVRSGSLEAESEAAVVARLHRMGYTPLSVSAKPPCAFCGLLPITTG